MGFRRKTSEEAGNGDKKLSDISAFINKNPENHRKSFGIKIAHKYFTPTILNQLTILFYLKKGKIA
jgi:hypothetical protein